ncbi:MAG: hypothetical protein B7Y99_07870 [Caulobacterales bacterium 32-69-10]|nr:MAG: hypothetical protein B7Y99_07870 [Caulobacterales bacterium 32-69-10]
MAAKGRARGGKHGRGKHAAHITVLHRGAERFAPSMSHRSVKRTLWVGREVFMSAEASRPGGAHASALPFIAVTVLAAALTLAAPAARAADADVHCDAEHPRVEVTVEGLRSRKGDVVVEIYPDTPKGFLTSAGRLGRTRAKAEPGVAVCIPAPAPGFYAVVVYHDEDGDRHFSKNFLGLPTEGFGVSNNPPPALGKPSFSKVRFEVGPGETPMRVRVRYGLGGGSGGSNPD